MRLDKFLSNLKYGTRKQIKDSCRQKVVLVNNEIEKNPGRKIDPKGDVIQYYDTIVENKGIVYVALNKPKGYVSANSDKLHRTVIELLPDCYKRINLSIAGRLDIDTTGLLILSNDGTFIHNVTSPNKKFIKIYEVTLRDNFDESYHDIFKNGVEIYNGRGELYKTKSAVIDKISNNICFISICEGKYHQVKRMFSYVGNEVLELKRLKVGNIELGDLKEGELREFNSSDI